MPVIPIYEKMTAIAVNFKIIPNNHARRWKYIMLFNVPVSTPVYGDTAVAIAVPTVWNVLPVAIRFN